MPENSSELCKYLSHGVYVVGVAAGEERNAFTAAWVMQVSFKPLLLAISINPHNYSYKLLETGGICTVNVLGQHQYHLAVQVWPTKWRGLIGTQIKRARPFYRKVWPILIVG
jgi:flavin reductase (DIM6/NTAB) family NADH-FMN oxidoreductase RutF